jgi:hypothetical protein
MPERAYLHKPLHPREPFARFVASNGGHASRPNHTRARVSREGLTQGVRVNADSNRIEPIALGPYPLLTVVKIERDKTD